jgi:hypothetical protein
MVRTISHAHPMNSASDQTVSSRYSASPHSLQHDGAATAGYPTISFSDADRHVDPSVFNQYSYPMSRSTSGASDGPEYANPRLLTPSFENTEVELRKVSDSLGRFPSRYNHTLSPHIEVASPHTNMGQLAPHPQPSSDNMYEAAARGWGSDFAMSAERGKTEMTGFQEDTDYERERAQQIMNNRKLLEDVGLGGNGSVSPDWIEVDRADEQFVRTRETSNGAPKSRKASATPKRRLPSEAPVRASPRIASQYRNVSYAHLDGEDHESEEDEYNSDAEVDDEMDEEEFRPVKRFKGGRSGGGRRTSYAKVSRASRSCMCALLTRSPRERSNCPSTGSSWPTRRSLTCTPYSTTRSTTTCPSTPTLSP